MINEVLLSSDLLSNVIKSLDTESLINISSLSQAHYDLMYGSIMLQHLRKNFNLLNPRSFVEAIIELDSKILNKRSPMYFDFSPDKCLSLAIESDNCQFMKYICDNYDHH